MEGVYDATIAVVADEDVRAERAAARGHHAVDERAARQLSQEEKAARATYVVANGGTVEELELALAAVLDKLDAAVASTVEHPAPHSHPPPRRAPPRAAPPRAGAPCCAGGSWPASALRCCGAGGRRSCGRCSTTRCARSRSRCATRTSSASRRTTRASTRRSSPA